MSRVRTITFRAEEARITERLQRIREQFGLISDAAAVRFAVRLVARMGAEDVVRLLNQSNQTEVER